MLKAFSVFCGLGGVGCLILLVKVAMEKEGLYTQMANGRDAFMPMDLPNEVTASSHNENSLDNITETTLADISYLWSGDELDLCQISVIWREKDEPEGKTKMLPRMVLKHEEIEAFYAEYIEAKPVVKGNRLIIIRKLLEILDSEGVYSSVVRKNDNEAELTFVKSNLYDKLASISLWKHTLLVARKYCKKFTQAVMIPDALIISLAHDIGKIPSYYDKYYHQGDHCWASVQILNTIPEFRTLSNRDEIDRIIRGHHLLKTDFQLTTLLKEADGEARKDEIADIMAGEQNGQIFIPITMVTPLPNVNESDVTEIAEPVIPAAASKSAKKRTQVASPTSFQSMDKVASPAGDGDGLDRSTGKFVPSLVELPEWYDTNSLIRVLSKTINMLHVGEDKKATWSAVTGESGIVWINEKGVWEALRFIGGSKDPGFLTSEAYEDQRRNLLYSVVTQLGKDKKTFYEMIAKGYYQVPVSIITGGDRQLNGFLIPFLQEVFEVASVDLENRKNATFKRMVKAIKPKASTQTVCPVP